MDDLLRRGLVESLAHRREHRLGFIKIFGGHHFSQLFDARLKGRLNGSVLRTEFRILTVTLFSTFCVGHSNSNKRQRPSDKNYENS